MKHPIFKIVIAIILGILILMLSGVTQMTISTKPGIGENFPFIVKS